MTLSYCYLVHRPAQEYDESLVPYLVCDTEEEANVVVQELRAFLIALAKSLPPSPNSDNISEEEYWRRYHERRKAIEDAICPYDIQDVKEDIHHNNTVEGCVADVMRLPHLDA